MTSTSGDDRQRLAKAGGPATVAVLLLLSCSKQPEKSEAPPATPPSAAATQPSSYRVNSALPHGSIMVQVRARTPAESRTAEIPSDYKARNPEDASFCGGCARQGSLPDETLLVDPKSLGIKNVAVSLKAIAEGLLLPLPRATLDNACCRFSPHVLFAPVGESIMLKNSDPMSHGTMIWTLSGVQLYSVMIPTGETTETNVVELSGILSVTCPMHSWMRASIIAVRHPYVALTGDGGEARLDHVPAGSHDLVFWHERLGTAARKVEVTASAEQRISLSDADFLKR